VLFGDQPGVWVLVDLLEFAGWRGLKMRFVIGVGNTGDAFGIARDGGTN
jgi:hypothetical protein